MLRKVLKNPQAVIGLVLIALICAVAIYLCAIKKQ